MIKPFYFQIVNDMFAFFFSEHVTFSVLHETLEFLTVEDNFNVWHAAIKGLTKLRNMYMGSDALADIDVSGLILACINLTQPIHFYLSLVAFGTYLKSSARPRRIVFASLATS